VKHRRHTAVLWFADVSQELMVLRKR